MSGLVRVIGSNGRKLDSRSFPLSIRDKLIVMKLLKEKR